MSVCVCVYLYGAGGLVTKLCLTPVTSRTLVHQAPLSMDSPGKNTGVDCHVLLQGFFLIQGTKLGLSHWQADSLSPEPPGKPSI